MKDDFLYEFICDVQSCSLLFVEEDARTMSPTCHLSMLQIRDLTLFLLFFFLGVFSAFANEELGYSSHSEENTEVTESDQPRESAAEIWRKWQESRTNSFRQANQRNDNFNLIFDDNEDNHEKNQENHKDAQISRNQEEPTTQTPQNIFIYLPFRPNSPSKPPSNRKEPSSSTASPVTASPTTPRTTYSSPFPNENTRNLPKLAKNNHGLRLDSQWKPVSNLEPKVPSSLSVSASRTHFVQASPVLDSRSSLNYDQVIQQQSPQQASYQVVQSPSYQFQQPVVQSPPVTQHIVQQVQSPQIVQSPPYQIQNAIQSPPVQQNIVHEVQAPPVVQIPAAPPQQINIVQDPPQPTPVHVNLIRSPPQHVSVNVQRQPPTPVTVNFVRSEPQNHIVVNEPRVDVVRVQSPPVVVASPPRHVLIRAPPPPLLVHSPPPVIHHPRPVLVQSPPHFVRAAPYLVRAAPPLVVHAPPPCPPAARIVHAPPIVHSHPVVHAAPVVHHPVHYVHAPRATTYYSAPQPQRTRTVYHSVQYLPEQTHVYTTTQFSPATKTTIYESDHAAAYSAPKPVIVAAPTTHHRVIEDHPPVFDEPESVLAFTSKTKMLTAPIRLAEKIIKTSRRLRLKEVMQPVMLSDSILVNERRKKKHKGKKIFVLGDIMRKTGKL